MFGVTPVTWYFGPIIKQAQVLPLTSVKMYPLAMNSPPSPPETNITFGPSIAGPHRQLTGHTSFSAGLHDSATGHHSADTPVSRVRRQPSIFYNSPGHRAESRERTTSLSSKLLVVVVPPVAVVQEHGILGNTLSSGPSHRLSQGIVMPLFPNVSCLSLGLPFRC